MDHAYSSSLAQSSRVITTQPVLRKKGLATNQMIVIVNSSPVYMCMKQWACMVQDPRLAVVISDTIHAMPKQLQHISILSWSGRRRSRTARNPQPRSLATMGRIRCRPVVHQQVAGRRPHRRGHANETMDESVAGSASGLTSLPLP